MRNITDSAQRRAAKILAASTLLLMAACGSGSTSELDAASDTAVEATDSESTEQASEDSVAGGADTLRYSFYILPTSFDPHLASNSYDIIGISLVYDRLVHLTPDGEPTAGLATEWEFSGDGLTLDMTLRSDVTFHDGEPLTADAVKTSLDRGRTLEGSTVASQLEPIDRVEVLDPSHVRLHLTEPSAQLPLVLADRPGVIISPAAIDNPDLGESPVGTGMFELTELRPGDAAVFEAAEEYWDPDAVKVDRVVYRQMADLQASLNALRSGQLDMAPIEPSMIAAAEEAGLEVVSGPTVVSQAVQVNRAVEPFNDVNFRRALAHAIDREALVDGLLHGHGSPAGQLVLDGSPAYSETVGSDPYPYDPELARQLLADGGHDDVSFDLIASTIPAHQNLATALQAMFGEVGLEVSVRTLQPEAVNETVYVKQDLEAQLAFPGALDPIIIFEDYFADSSFRNPGRHSTPELMDLLAAGAQPGDDRPEALQSISELVADEALLVPLFFADGLYAMSPRVSGAEHWASAKPEFRGVEVLEDE